LQIKTKIVSSHTANSKPVKQEANGTVILPPLIFPGLAWGLFPSLLTNTRIGLKIAYGGHSSLFLRLVCNRKESSRTLRLGVNLKKLYLMSLILWQSKLECFFMAIFYFV